MDLIELSKISSKYTVGFEGNVSKKIENGLMIKPSGSNLEYIKENDFITLVDNIQIDNLDKKPSMELSFHKVIYEIFDCKYISHIHPVNTLKILCSSESNLFAKKRLFPDQVIFNGPKSCIVDYYMPGNELSLAIKKSVKNFIEKNGSRPEIILLKNHGLIVYGNTIRECEMKMDICEKSAEIFSGSNKKQFLKKKDIKKLMSDKKEKLRKNQIY